MPEPKQIGEILAKTSADKGFPAAEAQYNDLKSKYYGAQAYDFSETGLIATARPLIQQNRDDEAIKFLELNARLFPKSAATYVTMAQAQQGKKDTAGHREPREGARDRPEERPGAAHAGPVEEVALDRSEPGGLRNPCNGGGRVRSLPVAC